MKQLPLIGLQIVKVSGMNTSLKALKLQNQNLTRFTDRQRDLGGSRVDFILEKFCASILQIHLMKELHTCNQNYFATELLYTVSDMNLP